MPTTSASTSLIPCIWNHPLHRKYFLWAIALSVVCFALFKYFYPYPDFISDSFSYIFGAAAKLDVNIWPIGYSKFLALIHALTHSDLALVAIQHFLLQLSALYFFFTFLYLFSPQPRTTLLLFLFLFLNPMFLFLGNLVNSDALFAALSLLWLSELLWIIRRPKAVHLLASGILLFLCFTVRNNAYYYPVVAAVAFLLSRARLAFKISGIVFPFLFIIPFILYTREAAFRMTGTRQYSFFTGWQLANNALYGYRYMDVDTAELPTPATRALDRLSHQFFESRRTYLDARLSDFVGNYFITHLTSPLHEYFVTHYDQTTDYKVAQSWGEVSVIYEDYGTALIKQNPLAYFRGFALLNLKYYLYPPLSNFDLFNRGQDNIWPMAQDWFDWHTPGIKSASKYAERYIVFFYPLLFLFLNVYIIVALTLRQFQRNPVRLSSLVVISLVYVALNLGFTILSAMNILRYQVVPMVVCLITATSLTNLFRISALPGESRRQRAQQEIISPTPIL